MQHSDARRAAQAAFLRAFPSYHSTEALDVLRAEEYGRLDAAGHVYLDYTGAGLYAASQLRSHLDLLARDVLGNPHSASLTSAASTTLVERTRRRVAEWFNAAAPEYTVIFTSNASAAIKAVGEAYPFAPGGRLLLTFDNHNSVNGVREFAAAKGAAVEYAPLTLPDLRIDPAALERQLDATATGPKLFAYPAQSNFSGVKHPLDLVDRAHARGWDVLLDAAAFVPTNRLDLSVVHPDFVAVSFYKMFGYPTGVGCLLARHEALERLRRPWFAGGTVNFATVHRRAHILSPREAGFEDGTVDFLAIPAIGIGLDHLEATGLDHIQARVTALTGWIIGQLLELRHGSGRHMVRLYGPAGTTDRGATITFNLYDPDGHLLDYRRIEELATAQRISLRTGCFCNPGAGETAEGVTDEDVDIALERAEDMTLPRFMRIIQDRGGRSAGAIRASLGIVSNFDDAFQFVEFVKGFRDQTRLTIGAVTFDIESCRVIRDGS
jgi:selenocysteine lyase/cysteine desulfurase